MSQSLRRWTWFSYLVGRQHDLPASGRHDAFPVGPVEREPHVSPRRVLAATDLPAARVATGFRLRRLCRLVLSPFLPHTSDHNRASTGRR